MNVKRYQQGEYKLNIRTNCGNCEEEKTPKPRKKNSQKGIEEFWRPFKRDKKQYYDNVCKGMEDKNRHGKTSLSEDP